MLVIQQSDFKNFFSLAQSPTDANLLQEYIVKYERSCILNLLGKDLGLLFIADLVAGIPVTARFVTIFNELFVQDAEWDLLRESRGIKHILLSYVYYHYVRDTQTRNTQSGVGNTHIDTATKVSYENAYRVGEKKFNEALISIETIQWFCDEEQSVDYPEYAGQEFTPKFSAIL